MLDRTEPAAPASPTRVRPASIAGLRSRSPGSSAVAANSTNVSSAVENSSIPTELPDSTSLEQKLSRNGTSPDWRERYTYQLGLMASYEKCMGGRVAHGIVYYYITWQIDEDHLGSSPEFELANEPMQGDFAAENSLAFAACVKAYLAVHDSVYLPSTDGPRMAWGMGAIFPLSDSLLLKMIAEATNNNGPKPAGSDSAPPNAATGRP